MLRLTRIAAVGLVLSALAACEGSATAPPAPAPTVTVTATPPAATVESVDPCALLVDGQRPSGVDPEAMAFVFVTSPTPGEVVSSGFRFAGCSNAFEASHVWRLLDQDGRIVAEGFGSATCGTGCVGTFSQTVEFVVDRPGVGSLEVFTSSAKDGAAQDRNTIPLILLP